MSLSSSIVFRNTVATAVHEAVCEYTGSDGMGQCDLYALAGMILLREVTGQPYQLQLGSLMYLADPTGNGWFQIDARNGGLDRLEYHAWIGLAGEYAKSVQGSGHNLYHIGEFVDFSVRHFRSMVERMPQIESAHKIGEGYLLTLSPEADKIDWTRPDGPPDYLWTTEVPPDEYRYTPDAACMIAYYDCLKERPRMMRALRQIVREHYRRLSAGEPS